MYKSSIAELSRIYLIHGDGFWDKWVYKYDGKFSLDTLENLGYISPKTSKKMEYRLTTSCIKLIGEHCGR